MNFQSIKNLILILLLCVFGIILGRYVTDTSQEKFASKSDKSLKVITIPFGYKFTSLDLRDGSYNTSEASLKCQGHEIKDSTAIDHQHCQIDTITIYDSEIETYQDSPPTIKKIPIYQIIQRRQ